VPICPGAAQSFVSKIFYFPFSEANVPKFIWRKIRFWKYPSQWLEAGARWPRNWAAQRSAASPSQMGRFETQWLAAPKNFAALADLSGQWIDLVHGRAGAADCVVADFGTISC
jgi:hypothetical protein